MVATAERKLKAFRALRTELCGDLRVAEQSLDNIRSKIEWNVWSPQNTDGFLTSQLESYYQCIEVGQANNLR